MSHEDLLNLKLVFLYRVAEGHELVAEYIRVSQVFFGVLAVNQDLVELTGQDKA